MADLDLLGGGYTGHLGMTHGARRLGSYYIRSHNRRPARPTAAQSSAWTACASLSRMAHTLARYAWPHLGLQDGGRTRAGAVAHYARAMIATQTWSPIHWLRVVPPGDRVRLTALAWLPGLPLIRATLTISLSLGIPQGSAILAWVMDQAGYCGRPQATTPERPILDLYPPETSHGSLWVCSLLCSSYGRRVRLTDGGCMMVPPLLTPPARGVGKK